MVDDRYLYSRAELSKVYGISPATVGTMIGNGVLPVKKGTRVYFNIADVLQIKDCRKTSAMAKNQWGEWGDDPDEEAESNPDRMKPSDRRLWYQSEDLRQSTMLKERKNAVESRELIPVREVEIGLASAFKAVALMLDTLPDALERDGVIPSEQINTVIKILDSSREQLVQDLLKSNMKQVGGMLSMMVDK